MIGDIEAYSLIDAGAIVPVSSLANDADGKLKPEYASASKAEVTANDE